MASVRWVHAPADERRGKLLRPASMAAAVEAAVPRAGAADDAELVPEGGAGPVQSHRGVVRGDTLVAGSLGDALPLQVHAADEPPPLRLERRDEFVDARADR